MKEQAQERLIWLIVAVLIAATSNHLIASAYKSSIWSDCVNDRVWGQDVGGFDHQGKAQLAEKCRELVKP